MLTVAVTGPTGEIGRAFISALERMPEVERVIGMARRPFDLAGHGWEKTEYRRGDVLDRDAVDALVEDADVVVHLAFAIVAGGSESREVNLNGSRNVFEATAAAGAKRLVYTSSVAAYGFHRGMPDLLDEEEPVRGTSRHPYSAHKAAVEAELEEALLDSRTEAFVFRPCIVAGPEATLLLDLIPMLAMGQRIPGPLRWALGKVPELRPVLPDPGVPFQLVHHDDVAAALTAAVLGHGPPGVYNLAGPGQLTITDLAHALGWHAVPAPAPRRRGRRRGGLADALPARRGGLDRGGAPARPDGHDPRSPQAALDAAPRRSRDVAADDRRRSLPLVAAVRVGVFGLRLRLGGRFGGLPRCARGVPGADVFDPLAVRLAGLGVAAEAVERASLVGDLGPAFRSLIVPSLTGPVGRTPAGTVRGCQTERQEAVQMNLPFFSTLRL